MIRNTTTKLATVAAVAALFALPGFVQDAKAGATAYSTLHVEGFTISDADGQLDFATDFDSIVAGNSGSASANLTGFPGASTGVNTGILPADTGLACVGACGGIGQNDFTKQAAPANSFARGDSQQTGAAILNAPNGAGGTLTPSVTANTVAEAQVKGAPLPGQSGVSASQVGTGTTFNFSLAAARQLTFQFSASGSLEATLTSDTQAPFSNAIASFGYSITIAIQGGATVFSWSPDGVLGSGITGGTENADGADLTQDVSTGTPGTSQTSVVPLTFFSATTGLLQANINYVLTITQSSDASTLAVVPEPESLALLSFGLLALGFFAVRHRRKDETV